MWKTLSASSWKRSVQTILKVVNEDASDMRKGSELDTYYLTPKVKEGTVIVRVGYMDFLGAYFKLADLEFTIDK